MFRFLVTDPHAHPQPRALPVLQSWSRWWWPRSCAIHVEHFPGRMDGLKDRAGMYGEGIALLRPDLLEILHHGLLLLMEDGSHVLGQKEFPGWTIYFWKMFMFTSQESNQEYLRGSFNQGSALPLEHPIAPIGVSPIRSAGQPTPNQLLPLMFPGMGIQPETHHTLESLPWWHLPRPGPDPLAHRRSAAGSALCTIHSSQPRKPPRVDKVIHVRGEANSCDSTMAGSKT